MDEQIFDTIIIGSGAGGSAAAFQLVKEGKQVLLLEKGGELPMDGSTLDVNTVFKEGRFKSGEAWADIKKKTFFPEEFCNVGGKTKWYGAALIRFAPHEFEAEPNFHCLPWPIDYAEIEPYYDQAEKILHVNTFAYEPGLQKIIDKIVSADSQWRSEALPLGLKQEILQDTKEAKHFDGFASVHGYKSDAETSFLDSIQGLPNFELVTDKEVTTFLHTKEDPLAINGVRCKDGTSYFGKNVVLAAGAMTSPRLLQNYLNDNQLDTKLPSAPVVGANFKMHINSVVVAFSPFVQSDILRKTAIFLNDTFPHSSIQCLGWMDGELMATQVPAFVPQFMTNAIGKRAYGFFAITEDGSSLDNRIVSPEGNNNQPLMDYQSSRTASSHTEHSAALRAFQSRLLGNGLISVHKTLGLADTAHAMGSLVTGNNAATSVVDKHGKVHGMQNLYVGDGSVLPRSSRGNPALTIYAWGLRLGDHLGKM
jgi:choline dehydrogenase-like flavoprotein